MFIIRYVLLLTNYITLIPNYIYIIYIYDIYVYILYTIQYIHIYIHTHTCINIPTHIYIGTCDFDTATCSCPTNWKSSADSGPCGSLAPVSSDFEGLYTCPGLIWDDGDTADGVFDLVEEGDYLSTQVMYVSLNHGLR